MSSHLPSQVGAALALVAFASGPLAAQATPVATPAGDAGSPGAVVAAYYSAHSLAGPGEGLDTLRLRALFLPAARITQSARDSAGRAHVQAQSVGEYVDRMAPYSIRRGFREREIARREVRYGGLAHVWSTYAAQHGRDSATAVQARGVNSFHLVFADGRWWIADLVWTNEASAGPLPDEFLPRTPGAR